MKKGKQFKRLWSLMLLLIAMLMPQGAWAENFISEVKYGVNKTENTASGYLSGYNIIEYENRYHDFNDHTKGAWVFIGYKTSTNAADAITGLLVVTNDTESNSSTYGDSGFKFGGAKTMMVDGKRYYLAESEGSADMNNGNDTHKNPVYLYYTKDGNTTNGAQLITTLGAYRGELTANTTGKNVVPLFGGNGSNTNGTHSLSKLSDFGDTNKGGGGTFNYITYTTHTHSFNQYGICSCGLNHIPSGNGTSASPYEVEYYTDLVYLGNLTRNGNDTFHALQIKDIDCGGRDIVPLGGHYNNIKYYFKGTYDGGGHVISNAKYVNNTKGYYQYIGIFGYISSATVKNLGVVNSTFGGLQYIGAVCGSADSGATIDNCFALNNTITSSNNNLFAGICGHTDSNITNCYSDGRIRYDLTIVVNCYSVNPHSSDTYTTKISADDITSGRLCYLINKGKTDGTQVWYQKLGTNAEAYPTLKKVVSNTVYEVAHLKCDGVTKNGSYTYTNNKNITPNVDAHNYSSSFTTDIQATCVQAGSKSKHCSVCDAKTEVTTIPALGHGSTGYTDSYSWTGNAYNNASQDTKACTFTLTCKKCSTKVVNGASLTCTKTAHVDATCTATGSTTYQATGSYTAANSAYNYMATKTNDYTVAALGHGSTGYTESYVWTGNAYNDASKDTKRCTFTLTCKKCSTKVVNGASLTCIKTAHVDASCTATGSTTYQATGSYTAANSAYNYSATKTNEYPIAALSHDYSQVVDEDYLVSDATCGSDAIYHEKCSRCDTHGAEWSATGTATGNHTFTNKTLTDDPVEDGLYAYACDNGCGTHTDDHIIKDFNGAGNHLELTKDGEGNYSTSENIIINDPASFYSSVDFSSPVDFTAASVTFNRYIINDGGMWSFIVPFDIPAAQAAQLGTFYQYRTHGGGKVYFDNIARVGEGIVRANTAYFFEPTTDFTSITVDDAEIKATTSMPDATNPSEPGLYGTYSQIDIPVGAYGYYMQRGESTFVKAGEGNLLRSFRAYLWLGSDESMANARAFFGDYDVDAIEFIGADDLDLNAPIYNLRGQRIMTPKKGEIYIQNGKKVTKK